MNINTNTFALFLERRLHSLLSYCSTSKRLRSGKWNGVLGLAKRRDGALEFGERRPPKFDQEFDPFGENIYKETDYWEASFYSEPDETPVEVYLENLRKSEVIDKLKKDSIKFMQVESSELEEVLEKSESSYQLVFVHVPWCNGTKEIFPQVEALTASREQDMDFFRVALTKEKDSKLLEGVWLSPTIKLFKNKEEVSEL
eukprot:CAMPEP_0197471230 /NCGR_PEP_ID=MMETSP1309-20131121/2125_1 /TAXON_ID=464262 /ORGANISM="Genus nov. species nov., Strain RCC998" /LENGTH=199 /DNA_ID=CAMNT_0043008777 /DNA_START=89 /DNA_END=684 /DNA_ORIENTATION=+